MKAESIGSGVYRSEEGTFWVRPTVFGSRTWRKLKSTTAKEAKREGAELLRAQRMASIGAGKDPFSYESKTVGELIDQYIATGCPNTRLEPSSNDAQHFKGKVLKNIREFFRNAPAEELRVGHMLGYAQWRLKRVRQGCVGERMVDMEIQALSATLSWAVAMGLLSQNYIRSGRPRFQASSSIRRCREVMPESGDEINQIAEFLFSREHTQVHGWQYLLMCMTGLRLGEVCMLRTDAKPGEPGYIHGDRLDVVREKGGIRPWVIIHDDLAQVIRCHRAWLAQVGSKSQFWLPGRLPDEFLSGTAINGALDYASASLGLPKRTPHGCRAYYVTKWLRDGYTDFDVASMIGDQTVSLIHRTYGRPRPGEGPLSFRPTHGTAAWERWMPGPNVLSVEFNQENPKEATV